MKNWKKMLAASLAATALVGFAPQADAAYSLNPEVKDATPALLEASQIGVLKHETPELQNLANKDAIVVITGDHGYDLGEYEVEKSQVAGLEACRRNVTWIPLVMISNREDMPRGEQLTTASHSDVAPTILSALDIYDDNVFTGHDLWTTNRRITINTKYGNSMIETNDFTAVFSDPVDRLYSTHDYMQRSNVASSHPDVLKELRRLVDDYCAIVDYAYERGMF